MPRKKTPSLSLAKAVIPVRALDFVMDHTKDMRRTRAFYQKLFGLVLGASAAQRSGSAG